jgi:hypothetical protein
MARMSRTGAIVLALLGLATTPGCGGPTTLAMYGHTIVYEGNRDHATMSYDGRPIAVRYDQSVGAFVAADCDVGPGSTLDLLAEQVAASPSQCATSPAVD